jgi:hypothetical protein
MKISLKASFNAPNPHKQHPFSLSQRKMGNNDQSKTIDTSIREQSRTLIHYPELKTLSILSKAKPSS